jgi:serine/threonine protein kinase
MNFRVFEDDNESIVADERKLCRGNCGRAVRLGLDRALREYESCCRPCLRTNGMKHEINCGLHETTNDNIKFPLDDGNNCSDPQTTSQSLHLLLDRVPDPGVQLDAKYAKVLVDSICETNRIPKLDEKRLMLIFSRFTTGSVIPSSRCRSFISAVLRRIYKAVGTELHSMVVPRYFFVLRNLEVEKHYRFKSIIGRGSFGVVHRVVHLCSGQERVCKSIEKKTSSLPAQQLESEIRIIAQLDHPNVIRMYEFFEDANNIHIIMEFCSGGDILAKIKKAIKCGSRIPYEYIRSVLQQVLRSLAFMNAQRIIHKDLKPENIMLIPSDSHNGLPVVKVIDFGLSEIFAKNQEMSNTVAGTAFYMAPEIFRPPFNHKCDVWSCGVIAFFLSTGFLPYFGATVAEVKSNVLYRRLQWPATFAGTQQVLDLDQGFKAFVESLLEKDPSIRPSAVDALKHPWLTKSAETNSRISFSRSVALNMVAFSKLSFLKRAVINLIAHICQFPEFMNIISVFTDLDVSNRGSISIESISRAIQHVGIPVIESWHAAKSLDLSGTGFVSFTALSAGIILPLLDSDKGITRSAFECFNPNKADNITIKSLWEVLSGHRGALGWTESRFDGEKTFSDSAMTEMKLHMRRSCMATNEAQDVHESENFFISFNTFRDWLLSTL